MVKTVTRTATRVFKKREEEAVEEGPWAAARIMDKRQISQASSELRGQLDSLFSDDSKSGQHDSDSGGLEARHLCAVCPVGVNVGKLSGSGMKACCTRRRTVTVRKTRSVTKWTTVVSKVNTVSGRLFIDANNDGIYTSGLDIPIENWPVALVLVSSKRALHLQGRALAVIAKTTTNTNGSWTLNTTTTLQPGTTVGISYGTNSTVISSTTTVTSDGTIPPSLSNTTSSNFTCVTSADCPVPGNNCTKSTCGVGLVCGYEFFAMGTSCVTSGTRGSCNGAGLCLVGTSTSSMRGTVKGSSTTSGVRSTTVAPTVTVPTSTSTVPLKSTSQTLSVTPTKSNTFTKSMTITATASLTRSSTTLSSTSISPTATTTKTTTTKPCFWDFDPSTPAGDIIVIAGTGTSGISGDSGPATSAEFDTLGGLAGHPVTRDLLISDQSGHNIRQIFAGNHTILSFAGNGTGGFSGDGGPATSAQLNGPCDVAFGNNNEAYIADLLNNRLRRVDANGTITTLVGDGTWAVVDGPVSSARLGSPVALALDGFGNLYWSEYDAYVIRKLDMNDGIVTTIVGNGSSFPGGMGGPAINSSMGTPYGVVVDRAGTVLYFVDVDSNAIRKVDLTSGIVELFAGADDKSAGYVDGPLTAARFRQPSLMRMNVDETALFVAELGNHAVRKIDLINNTVSTVAGNGTAGDATPGPATGLATINQAWAVFVDASNNLFITDKGARKVKAVRGACS